MAASQSRIRVRYAETDQMGIAYHANFFVWFEVGRTDLLRNAGFNYKRMEIDDDCHLPVVEASCRFRSPARYDDELVLETSIVGMRGSVLKFGYRLLRADLELIAEGETTHVVVDRKMQKKDFPSEYKTAIQPY